MCEFHSDYCRKWNSGWLIYINCRNIKIREAEEESNRTRNQPCEKGGARGKNDACIRWKFRFLIHAPVTHRWRGKIEAIIEGWLVFDESLTRRERKRYGIDETSPCVRPCVQLKNKCRKSRARLSRKNEFSIQFFFALFTSLSPYYLYGLFLFCFCFFPSLFSSNSRTEEERMFKSEINFWLV